MLRKLDQFAHSKFYNVVVGILFALFVAIGYVFGGKNFVTEWGGGVAAAISIAALIFKTQGYWVWSIINAVLWLILFASGDTKLLAGLQVSYIIFSLYGIYQWAKVKFRIGYDKSVWSDNFGTIVSTAIFGYTLYVYHNMPGYTGTKWWWLEFLGVGISIISNWMDAFKYKTNWIGWTMTNLLFGPLFWHLGLMGPFVLTFLYQTFCIIGFYNWYKEEKRLAAEGKVKLVGGAQYA